MKKTRIPLFSMLIVFLSVAICGQTLEDVLQKNWTARGGLDKLKALKSTKATGKIFQPMMGTDMPAVIYQKEPNKMRMEMSFQDKKIVIGYDGQKAWMIIPFVSEDAQELPADQSKEFAEQADFESPLVFFKEKGLKLELAGEEEMEGTKVFKVKVTKKDGRIVNMYLDKDSGVELKMSMFIKQGDNEVPLEVIMGDYKPVSGVLMPHYIETKSAGMMGVKVTVDSYELNLPLEDSLFAMPVKKTEPPAAEKK